MAAFVLFALAVAGAAVVADLIWENPTAGQITVFHHTVIDYPEGWLLAIAAGLGFVVALLLVASVNSTKSDGRAARSLHVGGLAWRTRWRRPNPTMLACWMRSSAPRTSPTTSAGRPT